ncbi:MAG: hypothetical protein GX120_00730 [Methanosarcina mazei]|uniref:hypothetical protein n=1 Tax=Methanosarcina soligelidi TaxID=1036677 RepID=UPI00064F573C|nr:hypothetical protein [Methanosarcina soligelidi]NLO29064.1 hypothetical protein [Methanosarcina mazei]
MQHIRALFLHTAGGRRSGGHIWLPEKIGLCIGKFQIFINSEPHFQKIPAIFQKSYCYILRAFS